mmetsp:Transcript_33982/g.25068  ORF Transcript_33982/g.25068 Transcript_33982/m.25068 type:complete len:512 (-) Transcript_33982:873-2408(-)
MSAATTSIDSVSGGVKIEWVAPDDNGEDITAYKIEIQEYGGANWYEETTNCDGSDSTIISQLWCIVDMDDLGASPFNYAFDELVLVRVSAENAVGFGTVSSTNSVGAVTASKPLVMTSLARGADTSTDSLYVEWTALSAPQNGNSAILSYNLVWDAGSGTTNQVLVGLSTSYTSTSYAVTTGIASGFTYLFKIRALNIYGWSDFSTELAITASDVPSQMAIVSTSLVLDLVRVTFTAPNDNGDSLTAYTVFILASDGTTYVSDPSSCNGESFATVSSNSYCDIPMTDITSSPISLAQGSLIKVVMHASNSNGDGEDSQPNVAGVTAKTVPGEVTLVWAEPTSSDINNIDLAWQYPDDDGGSAILNYEPMMWNTGTLVWDSLGVVTSATTNVLVSSLTAGNTYDFQVFSENIYGWSTASTFSIIAGDVPSTPSSAPTVASASVWAYISWTAPTDNYYTIDDYEIRIMIDILPTYIEAISYCDGDPDDVIANRFCYIPMSDLTASPFYLSPGD